MTYNSYMEKNPMTDPTPTDFRALCAALAQPEPQGPTDGELYDLWDQEGPEADFQECRRFARAVLARWGRPAIEPVPQQEAE